MRYTTINDCWAVLEDCCDIDEVKDFIDEFPNKFGKWRIRFEKEGITIKVFVRNDYYDDQCDTMEYEERELEDLEMSEEDEDDYEEEIIDSTYHDCSEDEPQEMGVFSDEDDDEDW